MKITADLLFDVNPYIVLYEGAKINITKHMQEILWKYKQNDLADCVLVKKDYFKYPVDKLLVRAHVELRYHNGCISIYIISDEVDCPHCDGIGTISSICPTCDQDADMECEECFGSGILEEIDMAEYYDGVHIEKEVLYKHIDLAQGELDFTQINLNA